MTQLISWQWILVIWLGMAATVVTHELIFERQSYREESYPTLVVYAVFALIAAPLLCPYLVFWICKEWACGRPPKVRQKIERPVQSEPIRCGTPYLRNGGTLICQTDDMIEIVTREGTETMTVAEYEARKARAGARDRG
jgi:hypothetical protein